MTLSAADQKVIDDVGTYGWSCMSVGAGDGQPNFSYSIGWWESISAPEVIVFGLPSKLQHSMLSELYRQLQSGLKLTDGARVSNLIDGHDCIARPVEDAQVREYFGFARWYRRLKLKSSDGLQAFQIFWPGKSQGLFPWQGGCDDLVRESQPLLYLSAEKGNA